jgi:hypothetical protein
MTGRILSPSERARAQFVLGREAARLGVDRSLFRASPEGVRELPEPVAQIVRQRAPNWSVAIASAGCPAPLAAALIELFAQARDEEEGQ